jgi:peptidoglycan-N-acetylglucosamine deacetylase
MSIFIRKRKRPFARLALLGLPVLAIGGGLWYFLSQKPTSAPVAPAPVASAPVVVTSSPAKPVVKPAPASLKSAAPVITSTLPLRYQGKAFSGAKEGFTQKVVALTFDDGPWPVSTLAILDILQKENIKATFFCLGRSINNHPELLQSVAQAGHVLGNHSWNHPYSRMSPKVAQGEIDNTTNLMIQTVGIKPELFRPPGGKLSNGLVTYAASRKYGIVLWNDLSGDDQRKTTPEMEIKNVLNNVRPGAVVLMHDGGGKHPTVQALPKIIAGLKQKGYSFVTVPELLKLEDDQLTKAAVPRNPLKVYTNQLPTATSVPAPTSAPATPSAASTPSP